LPIEQLKKIGEQCSYTERRADDAVRDVISWLKCEYMLDRVGEIFNGVISQTTGFGIFIELNDIYVEGMIHISDLKDDYYIYDKVKRCLIGDRTKKKYRIGDEIKVKVVRVDLDRKEIDFVQVKKK
jgi:ribonuclease R